MVLVDTALLALATFPTVLIGSQLLGAAVRRAAHALAVPRIIGRTDMAERGNESLW
jgi:hypothetical protein